MRVLAVDDVEALKNAAASLASQGSDPFIPFPVVPDPRWQDALEELLLVLGVEQVSHRHSPEGVGQIAASGRSSRRFPESAHIFVEELGDAAVAGVAQAYATARSREFTRVPDSRALADFLAIHRPPVICFWGTASQAPQSKVEEIEAIVRATVGSESRPMIGFMVAEDWRQLAWLAFKTIAFEFCKPLLKQAFYCGLEPHLRLPGPSSDQSLIQIPKADHNLIEDQWDLQVLLVHSRSNLAVLNWSKDASPTLCSKPVVGKAVDLNRSGLGPQCHGTNDEGCPVRSYRTNVTCTRIGRLRSRTLFLNACSSWRLGECDFSPATSLSMRALDGWSSAIVSSRYDHLGRVDDSLAALAAWRAGACIGEIVRSLNPRGVEILSILGDPEQRCLHPKGEGLTRVRLDDGGAVRFNGVSDQVFAVEGDQLTSSVESIPAGDEQTYVLARRLNTNITFSGKTHSVIELCATHLEHGLTSVDTGTVPLRAFTLCPREDPPENLQFEYVPNPEAWPVLCGLLGFEGQLSDDRLSCLIHLAKHVQGLHRAPELAGWSLARATAGFGDDEIERSLSLDGKCAGCGLPTLRVEMLIRAERSREIPWLRFECPRCHEVSSSAPESGLRFRCPTSVSLGSDLVLSLVDVPMGSGVLWTCAFNAESGWEEGDQVQILEPPLAVSPGSWPSAVTIAGLEKPGAHFVRCYFVDEESLSLTVASQLVHLVR